MLQVCQRKHLSLSKDSYMLIVKQKTASMFAACCETGTILGNHNGQVRAGLKEFGMNFGIAFQIIDDCKDMISGESSLGKCPGQDMMVGEVTLPMMNLLDSVSHARRKELTNILQSQVSDDGVQCIRDTFLGSDALAKTKQAVTHHIDRAKQGLTVLRNSGYKDSLNYLMDYVIDNSF